MDDKIAAKKRNNKRFWDLYARVYDFEINRFSGNAYRKMYRLMADSLSADMDVLEVATGTGLIAVHIAAHARRIEAIDYSPKMIEKAKRKQAPGNVRFSVEDATSLSFPDGTFDAAIISNALHIMPEPERALASISRALKPNGLLIAPSYSHGHLRESAWNLSGKIANLFGFETYSKWTPEEYIEFIRQNRFRVENWQVLRAAFPLVYVEARKAG